MKTRREARGMRIRFWVRCDSQLAVNIFWSGGCLETDQVWLVGKNVVAIGGGRSLDLLTWSLTACERKKPFESRGHRNIHLVLLHIKCSREDVQRHAQPRTSRPHPHQKRTHLGRRLELPLLRPHHLHQREEAAGIPALHLRRSKETIERGGRATERKRSG